MAFHDEIRAAANDVDDLGWSDDETSNDPISGFDADQTIVEDREKVDGDDVDDDVKDASDDVEDANDDVEDASDDVAAEAPAAARAGEKSSDLSIFDDLVAKKSVPPAAPAGPRPVTSSLPPPPPSLRPTPPPTSSRTLPSPSSKAPPPPSMSLPRPPSSLRAPPPPPSKSLPPPPALAAEAAEPQSKPGAVDPEEDVETATPPAVASPGTSTPVAGSNPPAPSVPSMGSPSATSSVPPRPRKPPSPPRPGDSNAPSVRVGPPASLPPDVRAQLEQSGEIPTAAPPTMGGFRPPTGGLGSRPAGSSAPRPPMPSGPLPPPPKPPDFGSLAPKLGQTSAPEDDWEDDDEKTVILNEEQRDVLQPTAGAVSPAPGRAGGTYAVVGLLALLIACAVVYFAWPKKGELIVNVFGPGGVAVSDLEILVDGEPSCTSSPCTVPLKVGKHSLRLVAKGYQPPVERYVQVRVRDNEPVDIELVPLGATTAGTAGVDGGAGVDVPALGKGLRLKVDGSDRGELPVSINDLGVGTHDVEISGSDRYEPYRETITLESGQIQRLEPNLRVAKGLAKIELGRNARGARVRLECPKEGSSLLSPPTSVDVADEGCMLRATRAGYQDFATKVSFEPGEAEKTFTIALEAAVGTHAAQPPGPTPDRPPAPTPPVAESPAAPATPTGQGTLKINSIPVSNVVVDGRPVGTTPTAVSVSAGAHTVTFIHPDFGRQVRTVQVASGQTAVAAVRFRKPE